MPRSIAKVVLPPYKPTYDELYLRALEIHGNYVVEATQTGQLKIDSGPLIKEMKEAVKHYKELAWKEER